VHVGVNGMDLCGTGLFPIRKYLMATPCCKKKGNVLTSTQIILATIKIAVSSEASVRLSRMV
jgi:hypothetical protein